MIVAVIACDGGLFQGAMHAFDLAIRPGMPRRGEARLDTMWLTGIIDGLDEGSAFRRLNGFVLVGTCPAVGQRCERRAVIRPHRVDLGGHGGDERAQAVGSHPACGVRRALGQRQRARPLDGAEQIEAAFCRMPLGQVHRDVAQRRRLQLALGRLGACHLREPAEAMTLVAALQRGPGQVRDAVLQGIAAVIQGQQGMPATRDAQRVLGLRQPRGTRLLRPHRRIRHGRAPLPLRHRLWIEVVALSERLQALLTLWSRAPHGRGRAGAAVEYLSQRAPVRVNPRLIHHHTLGLNI
jgi:hypothetical protein